MFARSSGSFIGSAICTRRRPLRTAQRNTSACTSSAARPPRDEPLAGRDHRQRRVRHRLGDQPQPLPRVLLVEAHGDRHVRARREVARAEPDAVHRRRDAQHVRRRQARSRPTGSGCRRGSWCRRSRSFDPEQRRAGLDDAPRSRRTPRRSCRSRRPRPSSSSSSPRSGRRPCRARRACRRPRTARRRARARGRTCRASGRRSCRRRWARAACGAGGAVLAHVQREARGLDPQLVELGLVDDPQDLADVVVSERHRSSRRTSP